MSQRMQQLSWRAAIKQYDPSKDVSAGELNQLLEAFRMAPSSYGLQPFKIAVVENGEEREALKAASYGQSQVTDAAHICVVLAKNTTTADDIDAYIKNISDTRGVATEDLEEFRQAMLTSLQGKSDEVLLEWAKNQAYLAAGFMLYEAALMKVDTTPMEGFDTEKVGELLEIKGYTPAMLIAVGHRSADDKYSQMDKVRKPASELIERIK